MHTRTTRILGGIAAALASVGLMAATTGPATAAPAPAAATTKVQAAKTVSKANTETLYRKGKKTATITPKGAPAGTKVVSGKVTVKKGKKTVAKNKASYKAKKGTYKVTSTVTYQPLVTRTVAASDVWAECRVTNRAIISDRTQLNDYGDGDVDYFGQVTVRYTGTCTDQVWIGGSLKTLTWNTTWTEDDWIWTDFVSSSATPAEIQAVKLDALYYVIGDLAYVEGADMQKLPTYKAWGAKKTVTSTRTVVVK